MRLLVLGYRLGASVAVLAHTARVELAVARLEHATSRWGR